MYESCRGGIGSRLTGSIGYDMVQGEIWIKVGESRDAFDFMFRSRRVHLLDTHLITTVAQSLLQMEDRQPRWVEAGQNLRLGAANGLQCIVVQDIAKLTTLPSSSIALVELRHSHGRLHVSPKLLVCQSHLIS